MEYYTAKKNTNSDTCNNRNESLGRDTEQNKTDILDIYSLIPFTTRSKMVKKKKKKKYFYEKQEYWLFLEVSDWESRRDASEGMKVYSRGPECSMPLTWGAVSWALV